MSNSDPLSAASMETHRAIRFPLRYFTTDRSQGAYARVQDGRRQSGLSVREVVRATSDAVYAGLLAWTLARRRVLRRL